MPDAVKERSLQRGFTWAPVIVDDELDSGLGGGVCQVASTLHAAAVFGALDVVAIELVSERPVIRHLEAVPLA